MNLKRLIVTTTILSLSLSTLTGCSFFKKDKQEQKEPVKVEQKQEQTETKEENKNVVNEISRDELKGPIISISSTIPIKMFGEINNDAVVIKDGSVSSNGSPFEVLNKETEDKFTTFRIADIQPISLEGYNKLSGEVTANVDFGNFYLQGVSTAINNMEFDPSGIVKIYSLQGYTKVMVRPYEQTSVLPWDAIILENEDTTKFNVEVLEDRVFVSGNVGNTRITVPTKDGVQTYIVETTGNDLMIMADSKGYPIVSRTNDKVKPVKKEQQNEADGTRYSKVTDKKFSDYNVKVTPIELDKYLEMNNK